MGVFERQPLAERAPRPDRADGSRPVGLLLRHARGRLPLRDAGHERDRALRGAHVLQGHREPADRARHRQRDRRHRRRVQRLHRQGVHRATTSAAPASTATIALDVLVDMLRHSKFDPEEIEREKGVIVEEMNMYFDTPRDYISGVYDSLLYGDQPLGWDIIGRKETVRAATRDTFLGYIGRWYKPERMVVGVAGKIDGDLEGRARAAARRPRAGAEPARPSRRSLERNGEARVKIYTKASDQAHLCLGVPSYPLVHPTATRSRCSRPSSARDVVAPVHRGPRAARPRLLHLRDQPQLHRRGLALLAGRRRHRAHRRGGHDDRRRAEARSPTRRCPRTSSRRRGTSRRAGSCSRPRARTG